MSQAFNVAVVGATGEVGQMMLEILAQRQFPVKKVYALASEKSVGKEVSFGKKMIPVEALSDFDFKKVEIAFFSAGGSISKQYAPIAADEGCLCIDNSSAFRYEPEVPLIVPEVNSEAISEFRNRGIIANPNCSTIQMVVALKPIYDAVGIKRVNVATYQSVSGSGKKGINALAEETMQLLSGNTLEKPMYYPQQIAFNVLPQVDEFEENGATREEMKMVWETQKIFNNPNIRVNPTAVRVPVFYGHSEAINVETDGYLSVQAAENLFKMAPGIIFMQGNEYPTTVTEATGEDPVFVGRLREDFSLEPGCYGLNMWVVSDNIRKGAALNAVQIAELWLEGLV